MFKKTSRIFFEETVGALDCATFRWNGVNREAVRSSLKKILPRGNLGKIICPLPLNNQYMDVNNEYAIATRAMAYRAGPVSLSDHMYKALYIPTWAPRLYPSVPLAKHLQHPLLMKSPRVIYIRLCGVGKATRN